MATKPQIGEKQEIDREIEVSLRPRTIKEYIGQTKVKENIRIFIQAAIERSEALDHCLFYGPPGLGKTTLAHIISNEMSVNIHTTSGPALEKGGDLAALLTNLEDRDILFIDEIHRLHPSIEEILYPAMEDFKLDLIVGQGPSARTMTIPLKRFTLIGATTRLGLLTSPLRARFGITMHMNFYPPQDLAEIGRRSARILEIKMDEDALMEVAKRSRGTPRITNRFLRRIRDYAQVLSNGKVLIDTVKDALSRLEVDEYGLEEMDRKILSLIAEKFCGGPVGLNTIAAALGEEADTIEEIYEPFLLQLGFLNRTPRGRCVTKSACEYLGINFQNKPDQQNLF